MSATALNSNSANQTRGPDATNEAPTNHAEGPGVISGNLQLLALLSSIPEAYRGIPLELLIAYWQTYISRHVALTPVKPPKPRQLSDPEAFRGPNAPIWKKEKKDVYYLVDRVTGRPALLALHLLVSAKESGNWGIPMHVRKGSLSGRKFYFVGESPGEDFQSYWRQCIHQLENLMNDLKRQLPIGLRNAKINTGSFLLKGLDGRTRVKIQQSLASEDDYMHGLNQDPYYVDFLRYAEIPGDFRYIDIPVPNNPGGRFQYDDSHLERFYVNPAPYFLENGDVVKVTDCPSTFGDKLVEAEFSLCFVRPSGSRGNIPAAFIARPHAIALVDPEKIRPERRGAALAAVLKKEVKEEMKEPSLTMAASTSTGVGEHHHAQPLKNQQLDIKPEVKFEEIETEEIPTENGKRRAINLGSGYPVKKEELG
ncbi:hypothetical protein CVT24_008458 [Panaeolus cyanescens]|uniref:Uncharacterized protein n=1 Tax=Panaeolus cyanescens TaxID=181874 RepID=A0A409VC03_9AGAR|nr:hypothetical protein CVT24_008458 [Panaeolus cyanescens]